MTTMSASAYRRPRSSLRQLPSTTQPSCAPRKAATIERASSTSRSRQPADQPTASRCSTGAPNASPSCLASVDFPAPL